MNINTKISPEPITVIFQRKIKLMRTEINTISKKIYDKIDKCLIKEDISDIENINGNKKNAPRACKGGYSVYILYSQKDDVLYVGETAVSVKSRCFGDGSGAHKHKSWFKQVSYVKHYTKNTEQELNKKERKLIEQALSINLKPANYGKSS